jgi:tRNA-dihydrouridine synthase B
VAPWYTKQFGPANKFNKRVVMLKTREEFEEILDEFLEWRVQFLDETGELKPRYQPHNLQPSFMEDQPAVANREHIPVPKGPVEVW